MAVIDISSATVSGDTYTVTAGAATWQGFTLARWARKVTIASTSSGVYLAFDSMGGGSETPAEGGAVGTHKYSIGSGESVEVLRRESSESHATTKVYVAAQSGASNYTVTQEG